MILGMSAIVFRVQAFVQLIDDSKEESSNRISIKGILEKSNVNNLYVSKDILQNALGGESFKFNTKFSTSSLTIIAPSVK